MAMPVITGKRTYDRLKEMGYDIVTFRIIEKEVHSYKKYEVFSIINSWLSSNFRSTDFVLDKTDSLIIEKYARANDLMNEISAIPYGGGLPEKIIGCYRKAVEGALLESGGWFSMGLKLFSNGFIDEAFNSFETSTKDPTFTAMFASYVWMGHIKDIQNQRKEALEFYQKAMQIYPGFPVQHDNWNIKIDKAWIEERIKTPFKGIN
jgi:tetratricopeptide (TPR) repeat protein